ncbi:hypothetical protein [Serratia ureilytica]|uniref:hypothetical protein n=1 Tax=Serratia ureilytica TaxID=300181 RepID=UPI0018E75730|nr:hypothetical protein [Serratia ureilytica]MBJ2078385.1 hypothetical protein [Serratia ureilytica]
MARLLCFKDLVHIIRVSIILFFTTGACNSNATLILTSIEARGGSGSTAYYRDYKITWARIVGPLDNEPIPSNVKYFGPMEFHDHTNYYCTSPGNGYYPGVQGTTCVTAQPGDTWKVLEERWISQYGPTGPGIVGHQSNNANVSECVIVAGTPTMAAALPSQLVNNGELVCTYAPPIPDPRCYIAEDVLLDFGVVSKDQVIGDKMTQNVELVCELDANVSLNDASGKNGVIDFSWGKAVTKINGESIPKRIMAKKGANVLTFEAEITGTPNETGDFSGNYSLIVGYY